MRILFLLGASSRIRNFQHTILDLANRGHAVRLAGRLRKGVFELPKTVAHERVSGRVNPTERTDEWRGLVDLLRGARDYVRYFDPRYAQATRLVRRAYEIGPTEFVLFCERHPWIKRHWRLAARGLAWCEALVPSDPGFEAFLEDEHPDVVVVTPLVTFESYQTDYVKAAHRLGIPVVFVPFSWDNLTNKGLMRIHPDRVLVWNDIQRNEAVDLHGCAADRVIVTGAARFDDFFSFSPSTTREAFLGRHGLDPSQPMVLYLGSSQLAGPNEMELVRRWAESIRAADNVALRRCGILVRPHPALRTSWASVDLSDLGNVCVSLDATRNADQDLFDALYHAHAAVGLNTSAMLESAIVGRPVHTLLIPGFDEGQVGTIHFRYLVEAYGGLATVARDFATHHRQLAALLAGDPPFSERSRTFAAHFLRPLGIDRAVSPIVADEIERAAAIRKRRRAGTPVWHYPLQRALHAWLDRRVPQAVSGVDSTVVATSMSLRPVRTALEEIQHQTCPVFVGPWNDSIGNELLYWIPFVRWVCGTYGLRAERLIVLSRGGIAEWYGSLAARHVDVRTLFSPSEFEHWMRRTVPQREQDPKQAVMSPFDQEIVERAARVFELSDYQVLHPFLFFRVFRRLQQDRAAERLGEVLRHEPLAGEAGNGVGQWPTGFVAASVAFTPALPDTDENRRFLTDMLAEAAADYEVLVVDWALPSEVVLPAGVRLLKALAVDDTELEVQTRALARAQAFLGGFGDLAILAAFCGTPVTAYHSERLPADAAQRLQAAAAAGWGAFRLERARRYKGLRLETKVHA
jgi:hypothetical protein